MTTQPVISRRLLRMNDDGALCERQYCLRVVAGPDQGKTVQLTTTMTVGSVSEAGLVLTDPTVSRQHVELRPQADGVLVVDLGSRNGTFLGAARIKEAFLEAEAELRVGESVFQVSFIDDPVRVSLEAGFPGLIGHSPPMRELFGLLQKVCQSESPVLVFGETGTGKEVVAKAVHRASGRRAGPFVVFDCSAVSPTLLESELFGHVRGSFTGALSDRNGAFLDADCGTLFLDEVGELPLELQPRLLRALEAGTVKRVGENGHRSVDVRIIAATHRDLEEEVAKGKFRADLYYRLAVLRVALPPLRNRIEDVPILAQFFLAQMNRPNFALSASLLSRMSAYSWPGNLRELRNVVMRAVSGASEEPLNHRRESVKMDTNAALTTLPFKEAKDRLVDSFTREYLEAILDQCQGNISEAARAAGIARGYIYRLVERYGLRTPTAP